MVCGRVAGADFWEVQVRARGKLLFKKHAGFPLSFGDLVQTQKAALAQVLFPDGNAILIKTQLCAWAETGKDTDKYRQANFLSV